MMVFIYLVCFYITLNHSSEGRIIQAIIGRNVSFSFTVATKDPIKLLHNKLRFLSVWPDANFFLVPEKLEKVRVSVDISKGETIIVTINFLNITTHDAGIYTVAKQFNSEEFNDSVVLNTTEDSMIPKIAVVRHISLDSSLVLQCSSSNLFARNFLWKLNASMIENKDRYSLWNNSLFIRNLTADDQYNVYTCMEQGIELESDPYRIQSTGPSVIKFAPNVTVVFEYDSLNLSCNSDCNSVCAWQWTKLDSRSGLETAVSGENVLEINNITRLDAGKYSCKVQNVLSGKTFASYLSLDVIYTNMTTATSQKDDTEANVVSFYMTTARSQEEDEEINAFPSKSHLMYLVLGFGGLFAIGFFTCLLQKFLKCLRVDRVANRVANTITSEDSGEENTPEENPAESYWTIVSDSKGKLSTAVETNTKRNTEQNPVCYKTVAEVNQLEESSQFHRIEVDMELDGYIHPIHSNPLNTSFASTHHATEV